MSQLDRFGLRPDLWIRLHYTAAVDSEDVDLPGKRRGRLRIDAVLLTRQALQELHPLPGEVRKIVQRTDRLEAVNTIRLEHRQDLTERIEDGRGREQDALPKRIGPLT